MSENHKVMLLLTDGLDWRLVQRFLPELPNVRRLASAGMSGRILPFASTWGPPNFNCLLTASLPGTSYRHQRLEGLEDRQGSNCAAEALPEAMAAAGRKSVVVDYGVPGLSPDILRVACPVRGKVSLRIPARVFQTADIQDGIYDLSAFDRSGWPPGNGPLPSRGAVILAAPELCEGCFRYELRLRKDIPWHAIVREGRVMIQPDGAGTPPVALEASVWSPWIEGALEGRRMAVRFRLLSLSEDGQSMELLMSGACALDEIGQPSELSAAVLEKLGPVPGCAALQQRPEEPYADLALEAARETLEWVIDAGELAMREFGAELFLHKTFIVDNPNHQCAAGMDPFALRYDAQTAPAYETVLRRAYVDFDTCVGRMLAAAERLGDTHVVVVGDHGICINNWVCDINRLLMDAGLLTFAGDGTVDPEGSRVYTRRDRQGNELYINRDRVAEADIPALQRQVIDLLLDWRVPQTGERIIALALAKRDAAILGYWGEESGDVLFMYNPGCTWGVNPGYETVAASTALTTNHGAGIQTQDTGVTSNMGFMAACGPALRPGIKRDESVWGPIPVHQAGALVCRMLGLHPPAHSEQAGLDHFFSHPKPSHCHE